MRNCVNLNRSWQCLFSPEIEIAFHADISKARRSRIPSLRTFMGKKRVTRPRSVCVGRYYRNSTLIRIPLGCVTVCTSPPSIPCIYPDSFISPYLNLNSYGKRTFSGAVPELWNNLPKDIKCTNSIDDFKRKLKTFLFTRAYES